MRSKKKTNCYSDEYDSHHGDRPSPGTSYGCFTLGRFLGSGCSRWTFACLEHKSLVIKVPKPSHPNANANEAKHYSLGLDRHGDSVDKKRLAKCSLLDNGWLVMERVKPLSEPLTGKQRGTGRLPAWAERFDNCQVGRTRDGRVVAFDYAF